MTLIASMSNYGFPILLGDLLITSVKSEDTSKLPTYLQRTEGVNPVTLKQKIYCINDRLAIGMAGNLVTCQKFLEDVRARFSYIEVSTVEVNNLLSEYDDLDDLDYLAISAAEVNGHFVFDYYRKSNTEILESKLFQDVYAIGTGASNFYATAERPFEIDTGGRSDPLTESLVKTSFLISGFLGRECLTKDNLKQLWGAGFEIVYFDGNAFKKLDDVNYFVFFNRIVNENSLEGNQIPLLFSNMKYYNDILVLTIWEAIGNGELFGVLPLYKSRETAEAENIQAVPRFESQSTCCMFLSHMPNNTVRDTAVFTNDTGLVSVSKDEEGRMLFKVQEDVVYTITHLSQG